MKRRASEHALHPVRRKRIAFDPETWNALDLYARDSMRSFQELMDEAVTDLLQKHNRPVSLKDALRRSAPSPTGVAGANGVTRANGTKERRKRRSRAA